MEKDIHFIISIGAISTTLYFPMSNGHLLPHLFCLLPSLGLVLKHGCKRCHVMIAAAAATAADAPAKQQ